MALDLERIRSEAPACSKVLFLSTTGSSLMPEPVHRAQLDYLDLEANVGGYRALEIKRDSVENSYASLAKMLRCRVQSVQAVGWTRISHGEPLVAKPLPTAAPSPTTAA